MIPNDKNIDFSGVLPTEKDTLSVPDIDFSGVLPGAASGEPESDSTSFEKILAQTQSYKETLKRLEKDKVSRAKRREWLRSTVENWAPEYVLDSYNNSTMGIAQSALKGKGVFKTEMSSGLPQSWAYSTAVHVGSFFGSPLDIGLTFSGGKMAQVATNAIGLDKMAAKGFQYLVKKNKITSDLAKTAAADMAGQATWWTGALAAHTPYYSAAVNAADAIAQANKPKPETFISSSGDRYITYPSLEGQPKGIIESKYGKPSIGTGKEKRGLPIDVALYIEGQTDYFDVAINGGKRKDPIDLSAIQNADEGNQFETAMKLIYDNPQIKDVATGAGTGLTLAAARLGFRYLPANVLSKGATPLPRPRGTLTTIAGEVGTYTAASSLLQGDSPTMADLSIGSGIVLASRIPGLLGARAKRMKTKYKERVRTGPMSEEMKRKVAQAAEAETVDVSRLSPPRKQLTAGEKPASTTPSTPKPKIDDTKPIIVGSLKLLSPDEFATVVRRSNLSEKNIRRMNDVYELVQDPIVHIKDASYLKLGVPVYERAKNGELVMTGETVEGTAAAVRMLNRNDLPSGMATGDYMNTKIVGVPDTSTKKGIERITDRVEIPLGYDARVLRETMVSTDEGIRFSVQVGNKTYQLDEKNADLFLKFYTSQPLLKSNFEANNKSIFKDNFALTKIRRNKLKSLIRDELNPDVKNMITGDFRAAINSVGLNLNHKKWLDVIQKTNENEKIGSGIYRVPVKVNDMSEIEMKLVTERMEDMRTIRGMTTYIIENLEASSLRQVVEVNKDNFILNAFAPYISQLGNEMSSPAARSLLGMYSKVDRNIVESVTDDIVNLQLAIGMDKEVLSVSKNLPTFISKSLGYNPFRSELAEKWITGKGVTLSDGTKVSGFNDYLILSGDKTANRIFGQMKAKVKKVNENPGRFNYTPEEINFLNYRVNAISSIKRVMDKIAKDALKAGIQVPGIKKFYMPFVMDRKFRDVIYSSMKNLNTKVTQIMGVPGFGTGNISSKLSDTQIAQVKKEVSNWIEKLNNSKDKYKNGTAIVWREAEREIRNIPGNKGKNVSELDTWLAMNTSLFNEGFKTYGHLEKKRTLIDSNGSIKTTDILQAVTKKKLDLLDRNLSTLFTDYILGARKRIELVKMFGVDGKLIDKLSDLIPDEDMLSGIMAKTLGAQADVTAQKAGVPPMVIGSQKDALRVVKDLITGESQYTRYNQLSSFNEKAANIIFTNKISGGFAIVANAFQPFISFVPDNGIFAATRGATNYFLNSKIHDKILRAGPTSLTLLDELIPGSRALKISTERISNPREGTIQKLKDQANVENFTQLAGKPFMLVNLGNKILSAASADDYIKKATRVLSGKQTTSDKVELAIGLPTVSNKVKYMRNKMSYRYGLDPDMLIKHADAILNDNYVTKEELIVNKKLKQALESYAQWSQAGRDFALDSFSVNDPNARMVSLFKRWGKSQAFLMNDIYEFEMAQGNHFIPLTIAASGVFGGYMAARATEWLKDTMSGEKEYLNEKYIDRVEYRGRLPKIKDVYNGKDKIFMEDLANALTSAGTIGMLSDIVLGDEKFDALKFAVSPAGWNDLMDIKLLLETTAINAPSNPGTDFNRTLRYLNRAVVGPLAGSQLNHLIFKKFNYEPWSYYVLENWKLQPVTAQVPVQDEINLIKAQRRKKVEELTNLHFNLKYGPNKDRTRRDIDNILKEWNSSAIVHKYWEGPDSGKLNPYAIYPYIDIEPKITDKWIEKMNENEDAYKLKPNDVGRPMKRSIY